MTAFLITLLLTCSTDTKYGDPAFLLKSEINANYLTGSELMELKNVEITTQETVKFELIQKDDFFKPKKNENLTQFLFLLPSQDEHFNGVIQGIRFTKVLDPYSITKKEDGTFEFGALLIGQRDGGNRLSSFLLDCQAK